VKNLSSWILVGAFTIDVLFALGAVCGHGAWHYRFQMWLRSLRTFVAGACLATSIADSVCPEVNSH